MAIKKKIANTEDKLGNTVELWWSNNIANTPTVPLFLKTYAEIVEKGLANPTFTFENDNRVTWVQTPDGVIMGGICYKYIPEQYLGWIILSFTDPAYRGRGINELCHRVYEGDCRKLGAKQLGSIVATDNAARLRSAEKVGMAPKFFRMQKDL